MTERYGLSARAEEARRTAPVMAQAAAIGTVASLAVHGALAILGRAAGRSAMAPINATSHIVHGPRAGSVDRVDLPHTATGVAINHGASIFWALPLAWWLTKDRTRSTGEIVRAAAATGAVAGFVDYGLLPRRLSPGWHHALPARSVAGAFGAMAAGLALGAVLTRAAAAGRLSSKDHGPHPR